MVVQARELLTANHALIERAVAFVCRRYRFDVDDAEEFASIVNLRLVENDYAILRAYEERSGLATYISTVVQRMALDYRNAMWGKWRASAEAKRTGPLAIELEQLLHRDGRTLDDAFIVLAPKHGGVTRESLRQLAERLPERAPRHRDVPLEEAEPFAVSGPMSVEERVVREERRASAKHLQKLLSDVFDTLSDDDRLIFQLRFEQHMTVAQIARAMGCDQKQLYRRIEQRFAEIRAALKRSGVDADQLLDLLGREESFFTFHLGKREPRPSIESDEKVAPQSEDLT